MAGISMTIILALTSRALQLVYYTVLHGTARYCMVLIGASRYTIPQIWIDLTIGGDGVETGHEQRRVVASFLRGQRLLQLVCQHRERLRAGTIIGSLAETYHQWPHKSGLIHTPKTWIRSQYHTLSAHFKV